MPRYVLRMHFRWAALAAAMVAGTARADDTPISFAAARAAAERAAPAVRTAERREGVAEADVAETLELQVPARHL